MSGNNVASKPTAPMLPVDEFGGIDLALPMLARHLVRHGITAHEFALRMDRAFVEAAVDVLKDQGQDPSYSRIAAVTGIHRHAVSAIMEAPRQSEPDAPKDYQRHRLARVLTGWFESPDYTGPDGRPLVLPFDGAAPSFVSLVREFSGDIYPRIILDELLRVRAVKVGKHGQVRALTRRYTTGGADPAATMQAGQALRDLMSTLEHNLQAEETARLFQDSATSTSLPLAALPLLQQLIARRGAALLDDLQGWLNNKETGPAHDGRETIRAGVTIYVFTEPSQIERRLAQADPQD